MKKKNRSIAQSQVSNGLILRKAILKVQSRFKQGLSRIQKETIDYEKHVRYFQDELSNLC